jgi:hypothetical protein
MGLIINRGGLKSGLKKDHKEVRSESGNQEVEGLENLFSSPTSTTSSFLEKRELSKLRNTFPIARKDDPHRRCSGVLFDLQNVLDVESEMLGRLISYNNPLNDGRAK